MKIKLKRLHKDAKIPMYGTKDSAGADLYAVEDVSFRPGELKMVCTGWMAEIPSGYYIEIYNRGSMAAKKQLVIVSSRVVDSDYRGEIFVPMKLIISNIPIPEIFKVSIKKGDRIAQMIVKKYEKLEFEEVDELSTTKRSDGGFGSTGK